VTQADTLVFAGRQRRWRVAALTHGEDLGVTPLAGHLLRLRGIASADAAREYLDVADSLYMPPSVLTDVDLALERIQQARDRQETVAVYGDFDADGVTGTAVLVRGFQRYGLSAVPYIPHRVTEGHGLNVTAIDRLALQGVRLIVTVDCGVTDVDAIVHAKGLGIDVIVTDHHTPGAAPPAAVAIVNPKADHSDYAFDQLTGVGMALKLSQALLESDGGDWGDGLFELAAIGTITDMAPLQDENRYIVDRGLKELRRTRNVGLRALMRVARIDTAFANAESIGFGIGPRLNAAGRMDHAMTAYDLLMTTSAAQADALASELDGYNRQRRELTEETVNACMERVEAMGKLGPLVMVGDTTFNPGVIGLAAGRLVERYGLPAAVFAIEGDLVMASCRSAAGFHWAHALQTSDDLLNRYGGHAQAAGFSCRLDQLPELQARLEAVAAEWLDSHALSTDGLVDADVAPNEVMGETFQTIRRMEPFGMGNPEPLFLSRGTEVDDAKTMGAEGKHLKLRLRAGGVEWDAVAFKQTWVPGTRTIDMVYAVGIDYWNGNPRLRLTIQDYAPSGGAAV
jgi:single-stranded-DNA-specific exonuclease